MQKGGSVEEGKTTNGVNVSEEVVNQDLHFRFARKVRRSQPRHYTSVLLRSTA
jgi:hypothetical protein